MIDSYLSKMRKSNLDKVVVTVDTNDGDYSSLETKLGGNSETILESAIILKTFYDSDLLEDGSMNGYVEEYLRSIEDEKERELKKEIFDGMLAYEYLRVPEGHSLVEIEVYYKGNQYYVESLDYKEVDTILNNWIKKFNKK